MRLIDGVRIEDPFGPDLCRFVFDLRRVLLLRGFGGSEACHWLMPMRRPITITDPTTTRNTSFPAVCPAVSLRLLTETIPSSSCASVICVLCRVMLVPAHA